jgi:hypothetical protein
MLAGEQGWAGVEERRGGLLRVDTCGVAGVPFDIVLPMLVSTVAPILGCQSGNREDVGETAET